MVTRVRPADIWRVPTRDSLSTRGSTRLAFVEDENTTWIHEAGSALDPSDSVVTTPTGQWHLVSGGAVGDGVVTDEYRREFVEVTPGAGETELLFGRTIEADAVGAVGVFMNGLRLTQEVAPLSATGFRVNDDRTGVIIGTAADGTDSFVLLVPVAVVETFGTLNYSDLNAGDTVNIPEGARVVYVFLNGFLITQSDAPGELEYNVVGGVLSLGVDWSDDQLVVEYSTTAALEESVKITDVADGEVYQRSGGTVTGVTLTTIATTDIGDLPADAAPESAQDYVAVWDTSSGTYTKVLLDDLPFSAGGHTEVHTEAAALGIAVYSRTINHNVYMHGILGGDGIQVTLVDEDVRIDATGVSESVAAWGLNWSFATDGSWDAQGAGFTEDGGGHGSDATAETINLNGAEFRELRASAAAAPIETGQDFEVEFIWTPGVFDLVAGSGAQSGIEIDDGDRQIRLALDSDGRTLSERYSDVTITTLPVAIDPAVTQTWAIRKSGGLYYVWIDGVEVAVAVWSTTSGATNGDGREIRIGHLTTIATVGTLRVQSVRARLGLNTESPMARV